MQLNLGVVAVSTSHAHACGPALRSVDQPQAYADMVFTIFDDRTRPPADRIVPIAVDSKNDRGRVPLHLVFSPPQNTYNGKLYGLSKDGTRPDCRRPEGIMIESDWSKPGDEKARRKVAIQLVEEGADVATPDFHDFRPLHYASFWGWLDVVEALLKAEADVGPVTTTGETPVMLACERGHTKVVELLLEEGGQEAGIESKNARGETPLMLAVTTEKKEHLHTHAGNAACLVACRFLQRYSGLLTLLLRLLSRCVPRLCVGFRMTMPARSA